MSPDAERARTLLQKARSDEENSRELALLWVVHEARTGTERVRVCVEYFPWVGWRTDIYMRACRLLPAEWGATKGLY